jgi:hypothetical protein
MLARYVRWRDDREPAKRRALHHRRHPLSSWIYILSASGQTGAKIGYVVCGAAFPASFNKSGAYDYFLENFYQAQTHPSHYHLHLIKWKRANQ